MLLQTKMDRRLSRVRDILVVLVTVACSTVLISQTEATESDGSQIEVAKSIELIRQVGPEGAGFDEARQAVANLMSNKQATPFAVLDGMSGASPEAKNWLRSVAGQLYERDQPAIDKLLAFFNDRQHDADARYLVFRWIAERDAQQKETLLDSASDDPSLPLRYLAIAKILAQAKEVSEAKPEKAKQLLQVVLNDGRNPEQLRSAADALKEMGQKVDLSKQLGMFTSWYVIGPLDNTDGQGFDDETEVEKKLLAEGVKAFQAESQFSGKSQNGTWQVASTDDAMGSLDLNPIFDNAKDATCYAFCRFTAKAATADARLGSINANKVWVNGQLVTANEVYHAGSMVDQYIGNCELKDGENWVLIKICQNNQTEAWAQDWQFQFRITDDTGKPLELAVTVPQNENR